MNAYTMIAAVLLPILGGFLPGRIKTRGILRITAVCVLLAEAALVIVNAARAGGTWELFRFQAGLTLTVRVDAMSTIFSVMIALIWPLAYVFAFEYMEGEAHLARFFRYFMMAEGALILVAYAGNFFTFFVGFEMMTLMTFPLVIHEQTPEAHRAAMKYLGYSIAGASIALFGFFVISRLCGHTDFVAGGILTAAQTAGRENFLRAVWLVMVIGFGAKAGLFPMHAWLPIAHPVAPSPASAVLSGLITKCGVLGIIRVTFYLFGTDLIAGTWAQETALTLAIITIFMGSMMALRQKGIKRRLAYSSVSQVSYVLFGIFLMTPSGVTGALLQVIFHALAKNALFLWAGAVIHQTGKKNVDELDGLGRKMPVVMGVFVVAALSLIGIPPAGGFVSKWYLATGGIDAGGLGLLGAIVLMVSALLTAAYLLPVAARAFFPQDAGMLPDSVRAPGGYMRAPLVLLAVAIVALGVFSGPLTDWIAAGVAVIR